VITVVNPPTNFVSRGGLKLHHALTTFNVDVTGLTCADLGCSTGGFTDCLLQAGAARVYAVDTAYGQFAWKLRNDPRVALMERTNALHATPPEGGVDLVVADLGWTPQRLLIPAALRWLRPASPPPRLPISPPPHLPHPPLLITLIKPHYELKARGKSLPPGGVLASLDAERIALEVIESLPDYGVRTLATTKSPVLGGAKSIAKESGTGNAEWLVLLEPASRGANAGHQE